MEVFSEMINVIIVDDHPIVRRGLKSTLDETPDIRVIDEATDGADFLEKAKKGTHDVVLLDLSMPGMSGFDALKQHMLDFPKSKVLVLSTYPEKQYAVRCLRAGALGFLTKDSATTELLSAIRKVYQGRKYVSAELVEQIIDEVDVHADRPLHEFLSDREFQVICYFGQGKNVKEIAEILHLSIPTVSTYRARILDKLKLETTAQLIVYVMEHKLIDISR
jgi:DNA-binding NarL/FixJ family response regulator